MIRRPLNTSLLTYHPFSYRMFDLAREYGNEGTMASAIEAAISESGERYVYRGDLFIISKVWPTQLGFIPTTDAIYLSMQDLGTTYIDMYLLHWPACNPGISWMHCETTVDPAGTWQESWHAMVS